LAAELYKAEYAILQLNLESAAGPKVYAHQPIAGVVPDQLPEWVADLALAAAVRRRPVCGPRAADGRLAVCVPLLREEAAAGALCLQTGRPHESGEPDPSLLQILARNAMVAVEAALLLEESRRSHAQALKDCELALEQAREWEAWAGDRERARAELNAEQRARILAEERDRLARQLHDSVAQILTSISLNLEWCLRQVPAASPVHERLLNLGQLARHGIFELRNAIFGLAPVESPDQGPVPVLQGLAKEFGQETGIETVFTVGGDARPLPPPVQTSLYHVTREALSNANRHARATRVTVALTFHPHEIRLRVQDDGVGIPAGALQRSLQGLTFGLGSMLRRLREVDGTLEISNLAEHGPRRGTAIEARVPLEESASGSHPHPAGR
ncbi:MAG: sensor histidine kinase, partial [Anaerolineae bacterium]|nr:sensor histidine kinase [Anaerolineae bacterium]